MVGGDQREEQGKGRVDRGGELVGKGDEDGKRGVEPEEVEQCKRAHREVAAALHGGVDVLTTGDALLE